MKNKNLLRSVLLTGLGLMTMTANHAFASGDTCDLERPIIFADLDWDSNAFHTQVARFILEKGYGCETDSLPGSSIPLLNGMIKGNIDITMEVWQDNVIEAWNKGVAAKKVIDVGSNFPDAVQGWYVPKYLVEGDNAPAKGLVSVTDLPQHKDVFKDPEQPEKGRFYNCIAGWSCETTNTKKMAVYGLNETFVNFRPGTGAALGAAIESSLKRKKPIVFYYWGPSWVLGKYGEELVQLKEPEYNKAQWDEMMKNDEPKVATAYPLADVRIGANKGFADQSPNIVAFLEKYETDADLVSKALSYMRVNDVSTQDTAIHFLKNNEEKWSRWMPASAAQRVKTALAEQ